MGADVLVEEGGVPLNKMKRNLKVRKWVLFIFDSTELQRSLTNAF